MAAPININANLTLNPASINSSAKQVQQALGRITGSASEFQKSLDASTARVFAFGATTAVINGVTQSFRALISTTISVQSKLVEINSILGAGAAEFNKYRNAIFDVAKTTNQSFETVADGAAELARQGLSATESAKRLEAALVLTRISGLGSAQSVKALTAAMNGFTSAGLSAEQVVNKIVAVDTAFAVSAQDLADGFSRAGSTAEDAGVSFDELLGLITAVEQRTARGGAVIGNAFKSIFTRLSRGSTIEDLKSLGVQIDATQTGVQKLQALSDALEKISDPTVASQIKELAGGVFQINVVSAALKDIGNDASVFGEATKKSFSATNEATEKNIALNEQLTAKINSLIVSVTSLGEKIGNLTFGPLLKNLVSLATTLSEGLDAALDPEKGNKFIQGLFKIIGGFIAGPGLLIFTIAFAKIFKTVIKFAREGFKSVLAIGSASEKIKQIEGGIVGLLQRDAKLRDTVLSTTMTQAQKEQAVISAIKKENALLTQQQTLVANIAAMTARRGVSGYSSSGGFKGKKGRRYSNGGGGIMEPDLETAMVNEARDAPRGASPFVTNFRGQPAVMNTSETQVKIGGREEILTAEQADQLIPRFNKGSKRKGRKISTGEYAYLVPKVGVKKTFKPMTHDGRKYDGKSPIRGPRQEAIKGASDDTEANLEGNITRQIINGASKWTQKLKPLGKVANYNSIRRGFDTVAGAKGGLKAAVGGAFEVAISRSLGYEAARREIGGDFDIRGGRNLHRIQDLFGITQRIADFKVSDSDGNKRSFLDKIRKEKGYPKDPKGKPKTAVANVSQTELNKAAAKQARLNVKNRYGNAKKFQQGTTTPLRQYRAEMEEAIARETERLKRDVYNNAASGFTNKDDRAERKRRGQKVGPMFTRRGRRTGRNATGSLSASKFKSLKRYGRGSFLRTLTGSSLFAIPDIARLAQSDEDVSAGDALTTAVGTIASGLGLDLFLNRGDRDASSAGKKQGRIGKTISNAKNKITNSNFVQDAKTAVQKKAPKMPKPKSVFLGAGSGGTPTKYLQSEIRNKNISQARKNVGKGVGKAGIGAGISYGINKLRDPVREGLTSDGQDTYASVYSDMALGGLEGASAMYGGGPLAMLAGGIYGTGKAGIDMYGDAIKEQEYQETRGQKIQGRNAQIINKQNLDEQYGISTTLNEDGSLNSGAQKIQQKANAAFGAEKFGGAKSEDALKEARSKAEQFAKRLQHLGRELVKTDHTTLEGAQALRKYTAMLDELDFRLRETDSYEQAKTGLEGFKNQILELAKAGSFGSQIIANKNKLRDVDDQRDFIGAMSGPNKENALRENKVQQVYRKTLDAKLQKENLVSQRDIIQGIKDPELQQKAIAGAGIELKEGETIGSHFEQKIKDAAAAFEESVRSGAKTMIMERIALVEKIKGLEDRKRQFTGGKDPVTGEMVQGSINSSRVQEIMQGANTPTIDAGRVRSIVEAMGEARDSGDQEKFQNAMANLNEALNGRLSGNEDKVLSQFGFDLNDPKNKAFFDKVGRDSVVDANSGTQEDRDFIYGLTGSGEGDKKAAAIDKEIESNKKALNDLNTKISEFGDAFDKKDIVDSMLMLADSARKMAEDVNYVAESGTQVTDIAAEARAIVKNAEDIVKKDGERIAALNDEMEKAQGRIAEFEGQLKQIQSEQN
jgi:TP901 family phage tail tape measure protein